MSDYRTMIETLRNHIGARLDVGREEGRETIQERMRDIFQFDSSEAEATLDALIGAGMIRYVTPDTADMERQVPEEVQIGSVANSAGTGSGAPLIVSGMEVPGYWEIGQDDFDAAPNVRKGQVRPTGL